MPRKTVCLVALVLAGCSAGSQESERTSPLGYSDTPYLPGQKWRVHDIARPHPKQVDPGPEQAPLRPPSDAVVLFDGHDLSHWVQVHDGKSSDPRWKVENGYIVIAAGTGDLVSKEKFGDAQYHVEWAAPPKIDGSGQWRGNSGFLLMSRYEIQVLDCWDNPTYADGQAGSIYGQWPPLVNPCRKPGQWQSYDIVFEAPRFEGSRVARPAYVTVFFNGVLVHNHQELVGRMAHRVVGTYAPHGPEEPLALQDHDTPVRYRNIWVRRLAGYDRP